MLEKLIPSGVPYVISGAILRGIRTLIATVMAGILTAISNGSIIANFHFIPTAYAPVTLLLLSTAFMTLDKYLREKGLEDDQDPPLSVPPAVPVVPDTSGDITPADPNPPDITDPANGPATDNATP